MLVEEIQLSKELFGLLDGSRLESKQGEAMMLLTVTDDHWPHVAMISAGEIVALNRRQLRLALWSGTTTTGNVIRTGKATLAAFADGRAYYVRLLLEQLPELPDAEYPRARFTATVASSRADTAKYADILTGVTIRLKNPAEVLKRWEKTHEELMR
ncbi:pyridoxamine 5'-phosphate oxidase family protein [Paenibacillus medicaginis]|uniref:Pyridoxamine 5'-phosphate oxidase family protein n=1 Tax=Paenibacillus medicaginis TaxID=1470560 RepID=A0ABV5C2Y1_9BACL